MRLTAADRKNTAVRQSACAALGLSYWAASPVPSHVWATCDETGSYHLVRISDGKASDCGRWTGDMDTYRADLAVRREHRMSAPKLEWHDIDSGNTDSTPVAFAPSTLDLTLTP